MNWESPLKPKKEPKNDPITTELKLFKKPKPLISKATVKRITYVKDADTASCFWFDRWIEQLVRERSYPPQLKSDDFYSLLGRYFEPTTIIEILDKARNDYWKAFPLTLPSIPDDDNLSWLPDVLRNDPVVLSELPLNFLS